MWFEGIGQAIAWVQITVTTTVQGTVVGQFTVGSADGGAGMVDGRRAGEDGDLLECD